METVIRADGIPLEAKELIPLIKQRKEMAETLAARFGDGAAAWFRGYNDITTNNYFISDFGFLLELCIAQDLEIKSLKTKLSDAEYELESKS